MFTFAGLLFLGIAWHSGGQTLHILQNGIQAQGIVIDNPRRTARINERTSANSRAPVVQFKTQLGEPMTFYSTDYTASVRYEIGQTVDIWYMPDDPSKATLNEGAIWILPGVFGAFGLVLCLIGLPMLIRGLFFG